MNVRTCLIRVIFLLSCLSLLIPNAYACNCSAASLLGTQVTVDLKTHFTKTFGVTNNVELPNASVKFIPNGSPLYWDIDVKERSILIKFRAGSGFTSGNIMNFSNLLPQLPSGNCTPKVIGMNVVSNKTGSASWLNTKSAISDHAVHIALAQDVTGTNWNNGEWIRADLTFGCSPAPIARNGMTWGFRGYSFPSSGNRYVPVNNTSVPWLTMYVGCNALQHNWPYGYAGPWPDGLGNVSANNPPANINQTRSQMCNAYTGDTSCEEKRYIMCIQESGNLPRPPYDIPNSANPALAGWAPRQIKPSDLAILGNDLTSRAVADNYCGSGWRMAEFHDGRRIAGMNATNHHGASWDLSNATPGGWAFHARLWGGQNQINITKRQRYWVAINNQPANCWD